MLGIVYKVFKESAFDCFLDLMPALHNYITIDTEAFLADENRVGVIFDMCKTVSRRWKSNLSVIAFGMRKFHGNVILGSRIKRCW